MGFLNFLKYNNLVPITVAAVLLGASGTYAAANPEAVYSASQTVVSIDNTYLVHRDLSDYTPKVRILHVTEDEEHYFVAYIFSTIALVDHVWQDTDKEETFKVAKAALGPYGDLGLYVTAQLKQKIDRELALLRETQEIERQQISQKVVATAYSGLVGAFLDTTTETLPGYEPVVTPPSIARPTITPPEREPTQLPEPPDPDEPQEPEEEPQEPATTTEQEPEEESEGDTEPPELQLLGENPARIAVGEDYTDLGAAATDNSNENLAIEYSVNGASVSAVSIDTSAVGEWTVRYEAADSAGNTGFVERTVEVYDPNASSGGGGGDMTGTTTPAEPEPPATSTPPEPEPPATITPPEPQPEPEPEPQPEPEPEPEVEPEPETQPEPTPEPTPEPEA